MHVALYSRAWPLSYIPSGIVTYVHCLREALIAQGHRVSIFAESIAPDHGDQGIYPVGNSLRRRISGRVLKLLGRPRDDTFAWGEAIADSMAAVHRRDPIDVVEMEESFGWCADVQRDLGVPVVVKLHGPAFLSTLGEETKSALAVGRIHHEGQALARMAAVISPSRSTLEDTVKRYGRPPGLLEHVPNPLPIDDDVPLWRLDRSDRLTILFVGRFDKHKGGDLMIDAFAQLLDRIPDAKLIYVGPDVGFIDEHGTQRHLAEYAQAALGPQRMASLSYLGKRDAHEIRELRTRAMITVVPSRWENQCYTGLEAMAQGCPVLGTDAGGTPEIIEHGVSGLICKSDDPQELCLGMSRLLNDAALCERLGVQAHAYVRTAHSANLLAQRSTEVYERAIAAYRTARRG